MQGVKVGDFFPDYRDPMFSIIILFTLVFIISFVNYWWGAFKSKEEKQSIKRFIKRFEIANDKETYSKLLNDFKLSTESLGLLAYSYVKSGDFETAINIYLIALKQVKARPKKIYILGELGKAYFKAGFLKRSAEVFLESLRIFPRDRIALKYLTVCFEKLKEYDNAFETLDSLEELGIDTANQKAYIKARKILSKTEEGNDQDQKNQKKLQKLLALKKDFPLVQRMALEYSQKQGVLVDTAFISDIDPHLIMDLLWYMDEESLPLDEGIRPLFKDIAKAKGLVDDKESIEIFELEVLHKLSSANYNKASLNFEFTCKECKQTFPIYFYRCPNCHSLAQANIEPVLINANHEKHTPFQ